MSRLVEVIIRIATKNGHPVECTMRQTLISLPLQGLQALKGCTYGPLMMAKLAGPLVSVKDTGKVQNQRVAKSQIVLILHILKE